MEAREAKQRVRWELGERERARDGGATERERHTHTRTHNRRRHTLAYAVGRECGGRIELRGRPIGRWICGAGVRSRRGWHARARRR